MELTEKLGPTKSPLPKKRTRGSKEWFIFIKAHVKMVNFGISEAFSSFVKCVILTQLDVRYWSEFGASTGSSEKLSHFLPFYNIIL